VGAESRAGSNGVYGGEVSDVPSLSTGTTQAGGKEEHAGHVSGNLGCYGKVVGLTCDSWVRWNQRRVTCALISVLHVFRPPEENDGKFEDWH